jgi:hypothetical protein
VVFVLARRCLRLQQSVDQGRILRLHSRYIEIHLEGVEVAGGDLVNLIEAFVQEALDLVRTYRTEGTQLLGRLDLELLRVTAAKSGRDVAKQAIDLFHPSRVKLAAGFSDVVVKRKQTVIGECLLDLIE